MKFLNKHNNTIPTNTIKYFVEEDMDMCKFVTYYIVYVRQGIEGVEIELPLAYTYFLEQAIEFADSKMKFLTDKEKIKIFAVAGISKEKNWTRHFRVFEKEN
jgi:hypothetical protein